MATAALVNAAFVDVVRQVGFTEPSEVDATDGAEAVGELIGHAAEMRASAAYWRAKAEALESEVRYLRRLLVAALPFDVPGEADDGGVVAG